MRIRQAADRTCICGALIRQECLNCHMAARKIRPVSQRQDQRSVCLLTDLCKALVGHSSLHAHEYTSGQ